MEDRQKLYLRTASLQEVVAEELDKLGTKNAKNALMVYQESIQETKLRKGPWLEEEDERLTNFVSMLGERKWDSIARVSGLNRSGKSCRLRWLNYLRPNLKRGHISSEEEQMIIQLHELWGNKWSRIARRLPGRTDNEIKNYWRTHLRKRIQPQEEGNFQCRVNNAEADLLFPKGNAGSWKYDMEDYELSNLGNLNSPYETRISDWMPEVSGHGSEVKNHEEYCNGLNSCFCYGASNSEDSDNSTLDCSVGSLWDMSYLHC